MKASELMIGDLVRFDEDTCVIEELRVDGTVVLVAMNTDLTSVDGDQVDVEELYPIPLTKEILVKNGFELCYDAEQQPFYRCKEDWFIGLWLSSDGFDYDLNIEVHYVHELQHLLRLVGVQKEIEL